MWMLPIIQERGKTERSVFSVLNVQKVVQKTPYNQQFQYAEKIPSLFWWRYFVFANYYVQQHYDFVMILPFVFVISLMISPTFGTYI